MSALKTGPAAEVTVCECLRVSCEAQKIRIIVTIVKREKKTEEDGLQRHSEMRF